MMRSLVKYTALCVSFCVSLLVTSGCHEELDLKGMCLPYRPECGQEDFDGDGVVNAEDTHPLQKGCFRQLASKQDGVCAGTVQLCVDGELVDPDWSSIEGYEAEESSCDGVDSDCDGVVDEGLEAPLATNQVGVCSGSVQVCQGADGFVDPDLNSIEGYEAEESACDAIDSDCDGVVDEGLEAPLAPQSCRGDSKIWP